MMGVNQLGHLVFLGLLMFWTGSCSGPGAGGDRTVGVSPTAVRAELPYPALRFVPPSASFLMVVRNLESASGAARNFFVPFKEMHHSFTVANLDRGISREIGVGLLDTAEMIDAGFDPTRGMALFTRGVLVTFVLPVASAEKVRSFLAERTRSITTYVKSYKGLVVTSWNRRYRGRGSFVLVDDTLLITLELGKPPGEGRPGKKRPGEKRTKRSGVSLRWLDQLLATSRGGKTAAADPHFEWAMKNTRKHRDILIMAKLPELNRDFQAMENNLDAEGCRTADREMAQFRRLAAGVSLRRRRASAIVVGELEQGAAKHLQHGVAQGPSLPRSILDRAAARLSWNVDPFMLSRLVNRFGASRCGVLRQLVRELRWPVRSIDRNSSSLKYLLQNGLSGALIAASRTAPNQVKVQGALVIPCKDAAARAFFDRMWPAADGTRETVAGRTVFKLSPPAHILSNMRLNVDDALLRITAGEGLMGPILPVQRSASDDIMFDLKLEPLKLSSIRAALSLLGPPPSTAPTTRYRHSRQTRRSRAMDQLARMLSRYRLIRLVGRRAAPGFKIEGEYELR